MPEQKNVQTWRITHVIIYVCAIGTSLGALLSYRGMNRTLQIDMDKCMLYSKPWLEISQKTGNCRIDLARTEWSSHGLCNFVLFAMLASFVYSIIALWFFLMCAPSTRGVQEDSIVHIWKIVPPASLFSSLLLLLTFAMAWKVTVGIRTFFISLESAVSHNCTTKSGAPALWENSNVADLYNERVITQILVWLMVLSWVMATLTLAVRCATAADFSSLSEGNPR
ncbi:hypothetical protein HPB47_025742 [Ixodes persulcatus]|uniref:Uncharacterized protein n=1 Tax=Ixodes persulcatus TaxID=34615 RepID=A0AC60Q0M6_IXOPE|nr:hypothetical protein HPB47_025742 [Ixodes persulcatus]